MNKKIEDILIIIIFSLSIAIRVVLDLYNMKNYYEKHYKILDDFKSGRTIICNTLSNNLEPDTVKFTKRNSKIITQEFTNFYFEKIENNRYEIIDTRNCISLKSH